MTLLNAIPALPVADIARAVEFYRTRLGFTARHVEDGFAIVRRDDVEIHFWEASGAPGSGAEPHLAGSASCRIRINGAATPQNERRSPSPAFASRSQRWRTTLMEKGSR